MCVLSRPEPLLQKAGFTERGHTYTNTDTHSEINLSFSHTYANARTRTRTPLAARGRHGNDPPLPAPAAAASRRSEDAAVWDDPEPAVDSESAHPGRSRRPGMRPVPFAGGY